MSAISAITEDGNISLTVNVTDNGNEIVSYLWVQISDPSVTINNASQLNASITNAPAGTLEFRLTIIDELNRTASYTVTVQVNAATSTSNPSSGGGGGGNLYLILMLLIIQSIIRSMLSNVSKAR
jgi:hypothetical protein